MTDEAFIYHLVPKRAWLTLGTGDTYFPATYEQDGFIHATGDSDLLLNVANHFYGRSEEQWLCLKMRITDVEASGVRVVFENAAAVGDTSPVIPGVDAGQQFPHIFGGLRVDVIAAVLPVERDTDGRFIRIAV